MKKIALCGLLLVGFIVLWQPWVGQRDIGKEALVISTLTAINQAQTLYASVSGHGNYAVTLEALSTPCAGATSAFLSPELARDPLFRDDYRISMRASLTSHSGPPDCHGQPTRSDYYLTAEPLHPTADGSHHRAFATDARRQVWEDTRGFAPTQPFAVSRSANHLE